MFVFWLEFNISRLWFAFKLGTALGHVRATLVMEGCGGTLRC